MLKYCGLQTEYEMIFYKFHVDNNICGLPTIFNSWIHFTPILMSSFDFCLKNQTNG
jgi:hypothetical protein